LKRKKTFIGISKGVFIDKSKDLEEMKFIEKEFIV